MFFFGTTLTQDILFFTLVVLIIIYKYVTRHSDYWRKRNVPGPTPKPFIGNLWDTITMNISWHSFLQRLYNAYEDPVVGFFTFDEPALLIRDPDIVKQILVKDFNYFDDRVLHKPDHNKVFGNVLFNLKNPEWKLVRTKISPVFSSAKIKDMFSLIKNVCEEMVSYMKSVEPEHDSKELTQKLSSEITTQAFFGIKGHCFNQKDSDVIKIVKSMLGFSIRNGLIQTIYFFKGTLVQIFKLEFFKEGIESFFKEMFWSGLKNVQESQSNRNNFISLLDDLRKKDPLFDDEDMLVAQGLMFFVAGIETTSSTIAFTLYELSLNKDIQERARDEIFQVIKKQGLTYDSLKEMNYLEMCILESLRKYPPVSFLDRKCKSAYKIPGTDIIIEKDIPVYITLLGLHNDEKLVPEPEKFIPERQKENINSFKFVYAPFGSGPRACIGERFGMLSTKLGLVLILMNFSVEKVSKTPSSLIFDPKCIALMAKGGIPLRFEELRAK